MRAQNAEVRNQLVYVHLVRASVGNKHPPHDHPQGWVCPLSMLGRWPT
jgi:hypothetical protein